MHTFSAPDKQTISAQAFFFSLDDIAIHVFLIIVCHEVFHEITMCTHARHIHHILDHCMPGCPL